MTVTTGGRGRRSAGSSSSCASGPGGVVGLSDGDEAEAFEQQLDLVEVETLVDRHHEAHVPEGRPDDLGGRRLDQLGQLGDGEVLVDPNLLGLGGEGFGGPLLGGGPHLLFRRQRRLSLPRSLAAALDLGQHPLDVLLGGKSVRGRPDACPSSASASCGRRTCSPRPGCAPCRPVPRWRPAWVRRPRGQASWGPLRAPAPVWRPGERRRARRACGGGGGGAAAPASGAEGLSEGGRGPSEGGEGVTETAAAPESVASLADSSSVAVSTFRWARPGRADGGPGVGGSVGAAASSEEVDATEPSAGAASVFGAPSTGAAASDGATASARAAASSSGAAASGAALAVGAASGGASDGWASGARRALRCAADAPALDLRGGRRRRLVGLLARTAAFMTSAALSRPAIRSLSNRVLILRHVPVGQGGLGVPHPNAGLPEEPDQHVGTRPSGRPPAPSPARRRPPSRARCPTIRPHLRRCRPPAPAGSPSAVAGLEATAVSSSTRATKSCVAASSVIPSTARKSERLEVDDVQEAVVARSASRAASVAASTSSSPSGKSAVS